MTAYLWKTQLPMMQLETWLEKGFHSGQNLHELLQTLLGFSISSGKVAGEARVIATGERIAIRSEPP